ncbi:MAG: copper homeostasis protein CutC [Pseudomonadota bacterium]
MLPGLAVRIGWTCAALTLGGLMPDYGVMRGAGADVMAMSADIAIAREAGFQGVVIGAMDAAWHLDVPVLRRLVAARELRWVALRFWPTSSPPRAAGFAAPSMWPLWRRSA